MPRKKKVPLPKQGEAFAVPLEDGRYSVCRVIHDPSSAPAKKWSIDCVLVACSQWIGEQVPQADDPALRPILCLTHHSWAGKREMAWISEALPAEFIPIGHIPPSSEETAMECGTFSGWSSLQLQPLLQWRWDHDRAAVLREDDEEDARTIEQQKRGAARRQAYLAGLTLKGLRNHRFFRTWTDFPSAKAIHESRKLMATTVRGLLELGESASEADRLALLQACIEGFNELDTQLQFIETTVREDICEEFEAIVHACGLGRHKDLADQWRDW